LGLYISEVISISYILDFKFNVKSRKYPELKLGFKKFHIFPQYISRGCVIGFDIYSKVPLY